MGKISRMDDWNPISQRVCTLPPNEMTAVFHAYDELLRYHPEMYNHEILTLALKCILAKTTIHDAADEYEEAIAAQEIMERIS